MDTHIITEARQRLSLEPQHPPPKLTHLHKLIDTLRTLTCINRQHTHTLHTDTHTLSTVNKDVSHEFLPMEKCGDMWMMLPLCRLSPVEQKPEGALTEALPKLVQSNSFPFQRPLLFCHRRHQQTTHQLILDVVKCFILTELS